MATDIVIPEAGESVVSGVLTSWIKPDGSYVLRDEIVAEIETDKITIELTAPAAGQLKHGASEGDELNIGAVVATVDESAKAPAAASEETAPNAAKSSKPEHAAEPTAAAAQAPVAGASANGTATSTNGHARATPVAEKLAAEYGVDLGSVRPTGPGGRIREQDVLAAVQSKGPGGLNASPAAPVTSTARAITHDRMSPLRQKIASRLVEAQQTAAMLTTFNEVDMTNVMALRKKHKDQFAEKHGIGLGFMSFFVRAVTKGLQEFQDINSYITAGPDGKPVIQRHNYSDVAIAVSAPKGLVVPVIRDAQSLSFAAIEQTIKDLAVRAKENKLELADMEGGTFTITNGGVFGSLLSTPILNPPQSAILGMHGIKNRAVEHPDKPGEIALRPMMYLALSYDHRIVDGAGAVRFLVSVKDSIEDPARLLLDV